MMLSGESCDNSIDTVSTVLSLTEANNSNDTSINTIFKDVSLTESKQKNESNEPILKCRYVIVFIAFFVYFYLAYVKMNMSINIVAMVNNSASRNNLTTRSDSCQNLIKNFTEDERNKMDGEFDWSPKTQGFLLGCYFFGHIVSQVPSGLFSERYGCKWFLIASSLVAGICSLLAPIFSYINVSLLSVNLMLRGAAQGLVQPALTVLLTNWFPKVERGFVYAFTKSGASVGSCLGSLLSGYICELSGGWKISFYVTGAIGILLTLLIIFFMEENPNVHSRISKAELNFILNNQENALTRRRPKLPWRKILTSVPVYALAYAYFGQLWALAQFWTVHATFLATILHYPIGQNGLLSAASFFLQFLFSQGAGWISLYMQKKTSITVDFLRKFWNFVACFGTSASILGMYLSECNRTLSVIFAIVSTACAGITFAGCWVVSTDISPTFAGTIHAFCITIGMLASCLVPVVTGYIINEVQTIEQWNKVFFLSIGVVMSSGIAFAVFGSAEVQSWNFVEEKQSTNDRKKINTIKEDTENDKNEKQARD